MFVLCRLLFELLVLTGAQVGSDWTSVLKKRQEFGWVLSSQINLSFTKINVLVIRTLFFILFYVFRDAFSEFDAETVSKFSEKKITSISTKYSIAESQVRGIVDNSVRILQVLISTSHVESNTNVVFYFIFVLKTNPFTPGTAEERLWII